jgi:hypothetical protein
MPRKERVERGPINPLWVIGLFVSLTQTAITIAATEASGWIQGLIAVFAVVFPSAVAGSFFAILWKRPYVFYAPGDFPRHIDVTTFVAAMRSVAQHKQEANAIAVDAAIAAAAREALKEGNAADDSRIAAAVEAGRHEYSRNLITVHLNGIGVQESALIPWSDETTVRDFLDDVWTRLADFVEPFTYGTSWVLRDNRTAVDYFAQLAKDRNEQMRLYFGDTTSLRDVGLEQGTELTVHLLQPLSEPIRYWPLRGPTAHDVHRKATRCPPRAPGRAEAGGTRGGTTAYLAPRDLASCQVIRASEQDLWRVLKRTVNRHDMATI